MEIVSLNSLIEKSIIDNWNRDALTDLRVPHCNIMMWLVKLKSCTSCSRTAVCSRAIK